MVARGAGAIGCAHCKTIGADRTCEVCTHQVCERCGNDWTTCDQPFARCVRLGLTSRLRGMDPAGKLGIVTRRGKGPRVLDLRRLRWVEAPVPDHLRDSDRVTHALTRDHRLFYGWFDFETQTMAVGGLSLQTGTTMLLPGSMPHDRMATTRHGDVIYYVATTQVLVTIDPKQEMRELTPLHRKVIQAAYLDSERGILASGTWGEVFVHRVSAEGLEGSGYMKTSGTLRWIEFAGPWLAACVDGVLSVWHLDHDESIGRLAYTHEPKGKFHGASMSADGRFLAAAYSSGIVVHDLDQDIITTYDDHTDDICLVKFAADDHLLITADCDNRVILRPRTPHGYTRAIMDVEVPKETVPFEREVPR